MRIPFRAALAIIITAVLILGAVGCAKAPPSPTPAAKPPPAPATTAAPKPTAAPVASPKPSPAAQPAKTGIPVDAKPIKLIVAGGSAMSSLVTQGQTKLKELLEKKSNGLVTVDVYPAGQLYAHKDIPAQLQYGAIDIGVPDPNQYSGSAPAGMAVQMPMGFNSTDEQYKFLNGPFMKIWESELAKLNTKHLAWSHFGAVNSIIMKTPVKTPADFKGKKVRAMGEIMNAVFGELGITVAVVAVGEVYTGLQRGTLDGAYSSYENFTSNKWMEPAKYVIGPPKYESFNVCPFPVLANINKWNSYPAWLQNMIQESNAEIFKWQYAEADKQLQVEIKKLQDNGVTIYLIPEAEYPTWTKAAQAGWDYIAKQDKENGPAIIKALAEVRQK